MNNMHNAGPEYATLTRREELRQSLWRASWGPEYNKLAAIKAMLDTTSFTTLDADEAEQFSDSVEDAMNRLEEKMDD
jgi:hypothetical protein